MDNELKGLSWLKDNSKWQKYADQCSEKKYIGKLDELRDGEYLSVVLNNNSSKNEDFSTLVKSNIKEIVKYLLEDDILVMSTKEGLTLHEYASKTKNTVIEVGTCRAGSIILMGLSDPDNSSRFISVDVVKGIDNEKRISQFGLSCQLVTADSHEYGNSWTGDVDMIFLDGNHLKENVYEDMRIWGEHLVDGGFMLMHDCLRDRQVRRFQKRKQIDENGMILSRSDKANVQNAVVSFLRDNSKTFREVAQSHSVKIIQKGTY